MRLVVAIGGNALLRRDLALTAENQLDFSFDKGEILFV
jgi:carbamate kinase